MLCTLAIFSTVFLKIGSVIYQLLLIGLETLLHSLLHCINFAKQLQNVQKSPLHYISRVHVAGCTMNEKEYSKTL